MQTVTVIDGLLSPAVEGTAQTGELDLGPMRPRCWLLSGEELRDRARCLSSDRGDRERRFSRSYREPYALVAGWRTQVGVDIERIEPVPAGFGLSIATPLERELFSGQLTDARLVAELWSGKEALAKALGDALRYDPRRLDAPLGWAPREDRATEPRENPVMASAPPVFEWPGDRPVEPGVEFEAGVWRALRLAVPPGHVGWLCWRV